MAELLLQGMKYQAVEGLEIKSHSKGSSDPIIIDAIATKEGWPVFLLGVRAGASSLSPILQM